MTTLERIDLTGLTGEDLLDRFCTNEVRTSWSGSDREWYDTRDLSFKVGPAKADVHSPNDGFSGVWSVKVKEKRRGQGHGKRLMEVITAWADAVGRGLFLHVLIDNEAAIRLYKSVGFRIVHTGDDSHYMQRYPAHIPSTPEWERHFAAKVKRLEQDHEPAPEGPDLWRAAKEAIWAAEKAAGEHVSTLDRDRYTSSTNYNANTRRLYADAFGAALLESGWTVTRINQETA